MILDDVQHHSKTFLLVRNCQEYKQYQFHLNVCSLQIQKFVTKNLNLSPYQNQSLVLFRVENFSNLLNAMQQLASYP